MSKKMDMNILEWAVGTLTTVGIGIVIYLNKRLNAHEEIISELRTSVAVLIEKVDHLDEKLTDHMKYEERGQRKLDERLDKMDVKFDDMQRVLAGRRASDQGM